jgi:arginyl-tRNA synthetase
MKLIIQDCLTRALQTMQSQGMVPADVSIPIQLEYPKTPEHGDFSSNLAFLLAKPCRLAPKLIAEKIIAALPPTEMIEKVEVAGAGFINFFVKKGAFTQVVKQILTEQDQYGKVGLGKGQKILLEFVSSNPTGPLHVGHGRGAAFGATLTNLLRAAGFDVTTEYYVNDAGRQMNILGVSVWLRYLTCAGKTVRFPDNGYQGQYVEEIASAIWASKTSPDYVVDEATLTQGLPLDESQGGDKEHHINALIDRAKHCLGEAGFQVFHQAALDHVLKDIQLDLSEFGVHFDTWFSEQSLFQSGAIQKSTDALIAAGYTYKEAGALWFRSTAFGDEKDRVLIRENGQPTYFASDVAYHWDKYNRGFDRVINVFGSDHHGYVPRIRAAVTALGHDEKALNVILVQFATLFRGEERVQMSTRSGSFVTLRSLREEVGNDAARFFYVQRKPDQHMEFDLALATSQSQDNPVYYIQYAYARICSVLRQLKARGFEWDETAGLSALNLLTMPQEENLVGLLSRYPEVIETSALLTEPHMIAYYLRELANGLHSYYNAVILICDDPLLRNARLCLLQAIAVVIKNAMQLLGVSTPESM